MLRCQRSKKGAVARMDSDARRTDRTNRRGICTHLKGALALSLCVAALLLGCAGEREARTRVPTDPAGGPIADVVVHDSLSSDAGYAEWGKPLPDSAAMGIGFVRPEDSNLAVGDRPQNTEVRLDHGEALSWHLILRSGQPTTLLVTALLDYRQVPFTLDGQHGLLHELKVDPEGDLEVPMRLQIDEPGAHDLLVMAFREPYDRPVDKGYRANLFQRLIGRRAVIIVGGVEQPVHQPTPDLVGAPPPPDVTLGIPVCFAEAADGSGSHPAKHFLWSLEGRPRAEAPYRLWVSNYHGQAPTDHGLVLFEGFHQVPLLGRDLFIVHLEAGHEAIIDGRLTLPEQPGVHEVQVVMVKDPYRSVRRGEVSDPFVRGSNCLGVRVHQ